MPSDRDLVPEDYLSLHEQALRLLELPELGSAVQRLLGDEAWGKELAEQPAIGEHLGIDVPGRRTGLTPDCSMAVYGLGDGTGDGGPCRCLSRFSR